MTYEYMKLEDTDVYSFSLEDVNHLGRKGWRVISWLYSDTGYEAVLLERERP